MPSPADWAAIRLTAELAGLTTLLLLIVGTPLAWWLSRTRSPAKPVLAALVAMPLVLPPTVLGFYLLLLMGPQGPVGRFTEALGWGRLPFTFAGLVEVLQSWSRYWWSRTSRRFPRSSRSRCSSSRSRRQARCASDVSPRCSR